MKRSHSGVEQNVVVLWKCLRFPWWPVNNGTWPVEQVLAESGLETPVNCIRRRRRRCRARDNSAIYAASEPTDGWLLVRCMRRTVLLGSTSDATRRRWLRQMVINAPPGKHCAPVRCGPRGAVKAALRVCTGDNWQAVYTLQPVVQPVGWTMQMSPDKRRLSGPAMTIMMSLGWLAARRLCGQ